MTENSAFRRVVSPGLSVLLSTLLLFGSLASEPSAYGWTKKGKKPAKEQPAKSEKPAKAKPSKAEVTARKASAKAIKSLAKARSLREKGKVDMALDEYQRVLELDPACAEAYLEMGGLYFDLNLPQPAVQMLEAGIPLAQQQGFDDVLVTQALCQMAEGLRQTGHLPEAITQAKAALEISPREALPWKIKGMAHLGGDDVAEALKCLQEAVRLDPQFVEAWEQLGGLALSRKDAGLAQRVYEGLYRCDTFKANLYKTDMNQAGIKAVAPPANTSAPPASPNDDPYAIDGVSSPAPALPAQTPEATPVGEPVKSMTSATPPSPSPPLVKPVPPQKPTQPTRPDPVSVTRPQSQKSFSSQELRPPTQPLRPQAPAAPSSGKPPQTTAYRSNQPLAASDTLLSDVVLPGGQVTTTLNTAQDQRRNDPRQTPDVKPSNQEPAADDPYAPPTVEPQGEDTEPTAGDDDPNLPDEGSDPDSIPTEESALPMLPDDENPEEAATTASGKTLPARAETSGSDEASELVTVATSEPEIPEDRIFALFSNLSSPDDDIAAGARRRLAGYGVSAAPHLIRRLQDSNATVRLRVVQTLGDLGPNAHSAMADLKKLSTSDPDPKVRQIASQLVQKLSTR